MNNTNTRKYIPFLAFALLSLILFYKIFAGYTIQGIDTALWTSIDWKKNAISTPYAWNSLFWLGMRQGIYPFGIYWISTQLLPLDLVLPFTYAFSIFLGFVTSYFLLGKFVSSMWGRIFGSISYSIMPPIVTLIYSGHIQVIEIIPYIPLVFLGIEEIFDNKNSTPFRKISFFGLTSLAWGMLATLDIQRGAYVTLLAIAYVFYLIIKNEENKKIVALLFSSSVWKNIGKLLIIGALSISVFSISLFTWIYVLKGRQALTSEITKKSEKEKFEFSSSWSFHPLELIDSVAFGFHGLISGDSKAPYWGEKPFAGNSESIGFFVILFLIIGGVLNYKRNDKVRFFLWSGVILLLLSFGKFWPGKPIFWLFYKLPLMSNFRGPAKFVCIATFCFSIIAGIGFDSLFSLINEKGTKNKFFGNLIKILISFVVLLVLSLFFIMISSEDISSYIAKKVNNNYNLASEATKNLMLSLLRSIAFGILSSIIFYVALKFRDNRKAMLLSKISILSLLALDLVTINWAYIGRSYIKREEFYRGDDVTKFLKKESEKEVFRVATSAFLPLPDGVKWIPTTRMKGYYLTFFFPYYGIETLDIPAISTVVSEYENFFSATLMSQFKKEIKDYGDLIELNERLFTLGNVKYLLFDAPPEYLKNTNFVLTNILNAIDGKPVYVYYYNKYNPRVTFYSACRVVKSEQDALKLLKDPLFPVESTAIVYNSSLRSVEEKYEKIPQKIVKYSGWEYKVELDTKESGIVVGAFKYEKDWKALIDGKEVETFPANYILTGVFVPEGKHSLEFIYKPSRLLFYLTLSGIIICLLLVIYGITKELILKKNFSQ